METREAACACGRLTARAESDPVRISVCHCLECKRRTGSAFGWNATYEASRVRIEGAYRTYARGSDDGFWVRHHFGAECGVCIFYEIERRPAMISIPAGAFADHFPPPTVEVYEERACPWLPALGLPRDP
ncbi:MAG TPA: GFA family protein [Allosphingosinicella sp.]|nr:GFA family protein [Allosphingosinicella sp.]